MDELFDGSDAHELCGACSGTGRVLDGEKCRFCEGDDLVVRLRDGRPAPVLIGDVVDADCAELRDIAEWFETRGKPMQGEFLRKVAERHQYFHDELLIAGMDGAVLVPNAELRGRPLADGPA